MIHTDRLAAGDPVRAATTFPDGETAPVAVQGAVPHQALALLPVLHREAGRDLHLLLLLASAPQFCVVLMLQGAAALIWGAPAGLDAGFGWATALVLGIAAVTRNHIRGFARSPRQLPLTNSARELRLLLLFLGFVWGLGSFLILPRTQAAILAFAFVAAPGLAAAQILKDPLGTTAFCAPAALLTAGAASLGAGPQAVGVLFAAVSIAGYSMLQRAIAGRRVPS